MLILLFILHHHYHIIYQVLVEIMFKVGFFPSDCVALIGVDRVPEINVPEQKPGKSPCPFCFLIFEYYRVIKALLHWSNMYHFYPRSLRQFVCCLPQFCSFSSFPTPFLLFIPVIPFPWGAYCLSVFSVLSPAAFITGCSGAGWADCINSVGIFRGAI